MTRGLGAILVGALILVLIAGCGSSNMKRDPITLDQVPGPVMKTAKEKLPGVTFTRAVLQPSGNYEILGKDGKGRTREIQVTPEGDVTFLDAGRK